MSNLNLVIICLLLAVGALFLVSAINAQQTRKRLINQKLHQLRRKIAELEEVAAALESLTGKSEIPIIITQEVIDVVQGMQQLALSDQTLQLSLDSAIKKLEELSTSASSCNLYRLFNSDAAIAHAQHLLSEAGRILKKRQAQGKMEVTQMSSLIEELAWSHLMVSVVSLVGQGHKAVKRGDIMRAHAFYKKAQETAMQSNISDDRRHRWIKEITDIMMNKQRTISTELMPETTYNPAASDSSQEAS